MSKRVAGLLLMLLCPCLLLAQSPRELRGTVELLDAHGAYVEPGVNVTVTVVETQGSDVTNASGFFRVPLPAVFRGGDRISFLVDKPGYVIYEPSAGRERVPADLVRDQVRLRLLPKGSRLLLSARAIEDLIREAAEASRRQVEARLEQQKFDLSRFIKDWAVAYGFSVEQVVEEVRRWSREVRETSDDFYRLGLAAFAEKQFSQAGAWFGKSAEQHEASYRQARAERERLAAEERALKQKIVRDRQLEGDAYANADAYAQAVAAYRRALEHLSRDEDPRGWAGLWRSIGLAHAIPGLRSDGPEAQAHFAAAVDAFRQSVVGYTDPEAVLYYGNGEPAPADTARGPGDLGQQAARARDLGLTRAMLGLTLHGYAQEDTASAGRLLQEAVEAYQAALDIFTAADNSVLSGVSASDRDRLSSLFAEEATLVQLALGVAFIAQSAQAEDAKATRLLQEAVTAYRLVLRGRTREAMPQEWAKLQHNLGWALYSLALRSDKDAAVRVLQEAAGAYRLALEVYTQEEAPEAWARVQHDLGDVLSELALRSSNDTAARLLQEAAGAYRLALEVHTRDAAPEAWGRLQHSLGHVLYERAVRSGAEGAVPLLQESVAASRLALEVHTRAAAPADWSQLQHNLGLALYEWAVRSRGAEADGLLEDAGRAYRSALTARTREDAPRDWAWSQTGLGAVRFEQALRGGAEAAPGLLQEAADAHRSAMEGFLAAAATGRATAWEAMHAVAGWRSVQVAQGAYEGALVASQLMMKAYPDDAVARLATLAVGVAAHVTAGATAQAAAALDSLIAQVAEEPAAFTLREAFRGAGLFIDRNESLTPHRSWLKQYLAALEADGRDALVAGLQAARERFAATYGR